ncbi:MAG: hypothetical protein QOC92_2110 [Acidimicrobiaceae bacterium]|jgi:uncharacterized spore protein YtfJ
MDLHTLLTQVTENLNAGRGFGPAYHHGDNLIVPVAIVVGGGGGGSGEPGREAETPPRHGSGSGGGLGLLTFPLGVYVVTNDRVKWVPALDMTRVVLSAIGLAKVVTKMAARRRSVRTG